MSTVRILIATNLFLLVALIFALSRAKEAPDTSEQVSKRPAKKLTKTPVRQTEREVLSALETPRSGGKGNRLNALDRHISLVQRSDFNALVSLHSKLLGKEQAGYDTQIERKIVLYRMGELDGSKSVRWFFTSDTDRVELAGGTVLEGWANAAPNEALGWWIKLPQGRKRESLLTPLLQGYLSAHGADWRSLLPHLTSEELASAVLPLVDSAIGKSEPAKLIDLIEEEFADAPSTRRNRIAVRVTEALCRNGDFEALTRWHASVEDGWPIAGDRHHRITRQIGASGGAKALDWAVETNQEGEMMRVAIGWVNADRHAAGVWLKKNTLAAGADEVAFQLAIDSVRENQNQARDWAQLVLDDHLAETIEGIISGYETE